jgi:hypothetical protein
MKFETLAIEPIKEMVAGVVAFIPTLLTAFTILIVGWIVARGLRKFLTTVLKAIDFDGLTTKMGLARILRVGGVKHKPSEMLTCLVYWVSMIMVLMTTIQAFGITLATDFLGKLFIYVPHVIVGALVLIIGMLLAKVVSGLVYVTAKNTDMPIPETLRDLSKLAIVVYVSIIYLTEIGFVSLFTGHYTVFITGIIFALALAFGLAGKDIAHKYLSVFDKK